MMVNLIHGLNLLTIFTLFFSCFPEKGFLRVIFGLGFTLRDLVIEAF